MRVQQRSRVAAIAEQIGSELMPDNTVWRNRFTVASTSSRSQRVGGRGAAGMCQRYAGDDGGRVRRVEEGDAMVRHWLFCPACGWRVRRRRAKAVADVQAAAHVAWAAALREGVRHGKDA